MKGLHFKKETNVQYKLKLSRIISCLKKHELVGLMSNNGQYRLSKRSKPKREAQDVNWM